MKNIFLFLILGMFLVSFVSALEISPQLDIPLYPNVSDKEVLNIYQDSNVQQMPLSACSFYHGYYQSSSDFGKLFLEIAIIFVVYDLLKVGFNSLSKMYLNRKKPKSNEVVDEND